MGGKYVSISSSGYNSSPPSDDGSQTAANLVKWSTHKTKLTDPIKTLADAINTSLVSAFDYSVRQITSSDNTVAGDHMRCVEIASTVTTAVTVSLGDAATMTNVYRVYIKNSSSINQTIGRVTGGDTIDGTAANITIPPGAGIIAQTNSAANGYLVVARTGPFLDTNALITGSADGTKKLRFEVDGITTGNTRVLTPPDYDGNIATFVDTTFVPAISIGGSPPTSYTTQVGTYTKIGAAGAGRVYFNITIRLNVAGAATGNVTFTGLPIAARAGASTERHPCSVYFTGQSTGGLTTEQIWASVAQGATVVDLWTYTAGSATAFSIGTLTNSVQFNISGHYPI